MLFPRYDDDQFFNGFVTHQSYRFAINVCLELHLIDDRWPSDFPLIVEHADDRYHASRHECLFNADLT